MNTFRTSSMYCLLASVVLIIAGLLSCNGTSPTTNNTDQTYIARGITIADYNKPRTIAAVDLRRNGARRPLSQISIDAHQFLFARLLFPIDSVFSLSTTSARTITAGSHKLYFTDSTLLNDSLSIIVADSFAIISVDPNTRLLQGLDQVTIDWSGSTGAESYAIAAVLRSAAYTGTGFSAYSASLSTAGTFPPDAFSLSPGPTPDTGWYDLYVYAISGAPDSAFSRFLLPTPLPSQLTNNIAFKVLGGNHGSVVVSRHDSIHVVQQL